MQDFALHVERTEGGLKATVRLQDREQPGREIVMTYLGRLRSWMLAGWALQPLPNTPPDKISPLSVSELRLMPLGVWDRAARAHLDHYVQSFIEDLAAGDGPHPKVLNFTFSHRTLSKLETIANAYRELAASGHPAPITELAKRYEVVPSTARSWIHRARKAGYLARNEPVRVQRTAEVETAGHSDNNAPSGNTG